MSYVVKLLNKNSTGYRTT